MMPQPAGLHCKNELLAIGSACTVRGRGGTLPPFQFGDTAAVAIGLTGCFHPLITFRITSCFSPGALSGIVTSAVACGSDRGGRQQRQFGSAGISADGSLGAGTHDGIAGGFGPEHDVFMLAILTGNPAAVAVGVAPMFVAQLIVVAIAGRGGYTQYGQRCDNQYEK